MMTLDDALAKRRSVRGFLAKDVPDETLKDIFALAQLAPSNCNIQPWIAHVISGDSLRSLGEKMVTAARNGIAPDPDFAADRKFTGVYRDRQVDAAVQLYGAMNIARDDRERRTDAFLRNLTFFDAPHAVLIFMPGDFEEREAIDLGIYSQSLMLAMTTRGVSSCAQGALSLYPNIIRDHLGITGNPKLLLGISFGYEDVDVDANKARVGREAAAEAIRYHR